MSINIRSRPLVNTTKQSESDRVSVPAGLTVSKVLITLIYFWTMFGVIVLGLRVFLLAFSANPTANFVSFIYNTSQNYLEPFRGMFPGKPIGTTGYFDVSALFAMIIYLFIAWGLTSLIAYVTIKITKVKDEAEISQQTSERKAR